MSDGFPYAENVPGNFAYKGEPKDVLASPGMLADQLRPIVLGGRSSCLNGTPMVPLHIATLTTIWNVLHNAAIALGEREGTRE